MICENSLFTLNDFGLEDMVSIFYSVVTLDVRILACKLFSVKV